MLKIKSLSKGIVFYLTIFLLMSCQGIQKAENKKKNIYDDYVIQNKLESIEQITVFHFHGWNSLDNKHLVISTKLKKPYLITLSSICPDLKFVNTLIVNNHGNRLQAKFDSISINNEHPTKCLIKSIHPITREQAKQLSALN